MSKINSVILLAAGDSTRMGFPKALLKIKNKALLDLQIDTILKLNKTPIVVLGKLHKEILDALPEIKNKSKIIVNSHPNRGQFSSLRLALQEIQRGEGAFVLTLDTPAPPPEVWTKLENNLNSHKVVVPKFQEKGGHPVLLSSLFVEKLISEEIPEAEQRLDLQIRKLRGNEAGYVIVENDNILVDLDTPEDKEAYFKCL